MTMTKKEKKVLNKIENEYRVKFNEMFVQLMLEHVPFDEKETTTMKIPTKKKMLSLMDSNLNPDNSLMISGMLSKFITERYEVIKK